MWDKKHLLGLEELSAQDITELLDKAGDYRATALDDDKACDALRGKRVVLMFFENSTRTRVSFEVAAERLGGSVTALSMDTSSVKKGESLLDTVRTIDSMGVDFMVVRHSSSGAARQVAKAVSASVINAGDGTHEHPTQGLLDMLTVRQHKGRIDGLRVGIVGDVLHSRVARSNLFGLKKLGASVVLIGPPTLVPDSFRSLGAEISNNFDDVIHQCDVLNMLRIQRERLDGQYFPSVREYCELFRLDSSRMRRAKPDVLVMHPGPMNRGIEITPDVADGANSVILEQVSNGVAVRMAVLDTLNKAMMNDEG
ncbi:MAG TPA: aspartate carbamoyltransferase catalytic subunit [Planctomycetota bacterium]|nr:aspartate carbamoyltransferase catalytic subunit [Planctomycetota bacterium]